MANKLRFLNYAIIVLQQKSLSEKYNNQTELLYAHSLLKRFVSRKIYYPNDYLKLNYEYKV